MSEPLTDAEWAEIQEWCAVNPNVRISEEGSILITRDGALQAVVHPRTFLDVVRSTLTVDTIRECAKQLKAANIQPGNIYRWVDTLAPIREKLPITDEARGECCIPVLKPEPQDADAWPEDNSIVFATIEDRKKAQQLFEDLQAQTTQAVLEEAEWWAAQAGHTGPAHPDMLDKDCAMCCRIVKLRGGQG